MRLRVGGIGSPSFGPNRDCLRAFGLEPTTVLVGDQIIVAEYTVTTASPSIPGRPASGDAGGRSPSDRGTRSAEGSTRTLSS